MKLPSAAIGASLLLFSGLAASQGPDLPQSQQAQTKVTTGATDVATDKTVVAGKKTDEKDATELSLQAGGMSSEGNARSIAITGATNFRLRRESNQFKAAAAGNYAAASPPSPDSRDYTTTVQNLQGMARYDRFIDRFVLFAQAQARNNKFAGYDIRLQLDPGVGYAIIDKSNTQLIGEVGYDFMYQANRMDARYKLDADKNPVLDASGHKLIDPSKPESYSIHSGRAAMTLEYSFNESSKLNAALEYLQGLNDTEFYRVNLDAGITTKLGKIVAFSFGESVRFDNSAAKLGKSKTDYITTANLVFTLL